MSILNSFAAANAPIIAALAFAAFLMAVPASAQDSRVFEMRTYYTLPGRLPALHKRFSEHTNSLFVKHGMSLIGYWTPAEKPGADNTLIYILAYPSMEAREKSWNAFRDDPTWQKAREESEKDGKIVDKVESTFLRATQYSPIQ